MSNVSSNIEDVTAFFYFLKLEKGLSKNTIASYGSDMDQFIGFVKKHRLDYLHINEFDINAYIKFLRKIKL